MATLPLTLIMGSEQVLVDRALLAARQQARADFGSDPERRIVSLSDETARADLFDALSPTLFGDPALVVITDADSFDDSTFSVIEEALGNPPESVALVVHHPGGVKGKRYLTALRNAGAQEVACPALKKGRATQDFLADEFRRRGRKTSGDTLRVLYDAIGHDIPLLVGAIDQLCADVESGPITEEHVRTYFAGVADMQGYRVSDAIWERRAVDALRDLRWSAEAGGRGSGGLGVTGAISSGLRSLAKVQSLPPTMSDGEAMAETGIRFDWQVRAVRTRAKRWRPDRLARAAVALGDLDVALKGGLREGDSLDPEQKLHELEEFVIRTSSRVEDD